MTVYRKRRQSQGQRQRRRTQRGGACGKFRGNQVPSLCGFTPDNILAYSKTAGCSTEELVNRLQSEGTCDAAKKQALINKLQGIVPNRYGVIRREEPPQVVSEEEIAAREAAAAAAAAARNATARAAANKAAEQSALLKSNMAASRTLNAERMKYTTPDDISSAVKRIKTLTVQQVIAELLQKTTPEQRTKIREEIESISLNDNTEEQKAQKLAIYDKLVAELPRSGSPPVVAVQNAAVAAVNAAVARKNLEVAKVNAAVVTPAAGPVHRGLGASFNAANAAAEPPIPNTFFTNLQSYADRTAALRAAEAAAAEAAKGPVNYYGRPTKVYPQPAFVSAPPASYGSVPPPTGEFYANPNPYGTGNLTRAETNDPALIEHWKRTGVPLYPTNRRTVRHQQEVKMNPWVHGGARRKTRRSKNRKTRKARS